MPPARHWGWEQQKDVSLHAPCSVGWVRGAACMQNAAAGFPSTLGSPALGSMQLTSVRVRLCNKKSSCP